jgi:hypothetical protein
MPRSVLVLKKLGNELDSEFVEVIEWLSREQHMQVGLQVVAVAGCQQN